MVTFGTKSAEDWGIVTEVFIGTPTIKTKFVAVPGRDGDIDATEALTGRPIYGNRELRIVITIVNKNSMAAYQTVYDEIKDLLHGKRLNVYIDAIAGYHFTGRCEVNIEQTYKSYGIVTVQINADPFMYKNTITSKSITSGTITVSSKMPTKMTLTVPSSVKITRGGVSTQYSAGTYTLMPLLIGSEVITRVSGSATISYQEGKL